MNVSAKLLEVETSSEIFPLSGRNIICFAKDWSEDPTSNNHLMLQLSEHNRVLWLNSISMRKPSVAKSDLAKIFRKLAEYFRKPRQPRPNLYVFTPLALPLPHSKWATRINRWILGRTIRRLRRQLGMKEFQLWTFLPNVVEYIGHLGESLVVYYCVDEWSQISYVDGSRMADAEEQLCRRADIVFATAASLVERRRQFNSETHLASHGVDHQHFATALSTATPSSPEFLETQRPIVGFYGLIHDWIDLDLIGYLARHHPDWSLVMIGSIRVDVSQLRKYPNIFFLGRKSYDELPFLCKDFSVAIIPFKVNQLTRHINPIKLREYLSAGLPVVSTELLEVGNYPGFCIVAKTYEEFEHGISDILASDSIERRRERSKAMESETWSKKTMEVAALVRRVEKRKSIAT
jgi:glycosyltransferase involved in cell wall biosynthesis